MRKKATRDPESSQDRRGIESPRSKLEECASEAFSIGIAFFSRLPYAGKLIPRRQRAG
jgi:hypothetical protein